MEAAKLPSLELLSSLFHYNPINGTFTYLQQRGRRAAGAPAGSNVRGVPCLWAAGGQHRAAAVAWALAYGADPSPFHVVPIDGDIANLRLDNLQLSLERFSRPIHKGRRKQKIPLEIRRCVRYSQSEGAWKAFHNHRLLGLFGTKQEACSAKRAAIFNTTAGREEGDSDA